MAARLTRAVRSNWATTILVCRKCTKKIGGGFGPRGKQPLAKALARELGIRKGRKADIGIVEVKCLGVCPKGAVTVVNGASSREWLLVPEGTPVDTVADQLGLQRDRSATHAASMSMACALRAMLHACARCWSHDR